MTVIQFVMQFNQNWRLIFASSVPIQKVWFENRCAVYCYIVIKII